MKAEYPTSVMVVAVFLMLAGTAPILIVFLMRRFQCVKADMDIHQAAIKRIDTTTSTTGMVREAEVRTGEARGRPRARACVWGRRANVLPCGPVRVPTCHMDAVWVCCGWSLSHLCR